MGRFLCVSWWRRYSEQDQTLSQTPRHTVSTEMSIFRGGLFIYPRPTWTRSAQEPKLRNASRACQGGGLTVGGSLNRTVLPPSDLAQVSSSSEVQDGCCHPPPKGLSVAGVCASVILRV